MLRAYNNNTGKTSALNMPMQSKQQVIQSMLQMKKDEHI